MNLNHDSGDTSGQPVIDDVYHTGFMSNIRVAETGPRFG